MVEVVYTLSKKDDKTYRNYYLKLQNGAFIPIQVKKIPGYEDNAKLDYAKLEAVAVRYGNK